MADIIEVVGSKKKVKFAGAYDAGNGNSDTHMGKPFFQLCGNQQGVKKGQTAALSSQGSSSQANDDLLLIQIGGIESQQPSPVMFDPGGAENFY